MVVRRAKKQEWPNPRPLRKGSAEHAGDSRPRNSAVHHRPGAALGIVLSYRDVLRGESMTGIALFEIGTSAWNSPNNSLQSKSSFF
jgi:hypothetical protein